MSWGTPGVLFIEFWGLQVISFGCCSWWQHFTPSCLVSFLTFVVLCGTSSYVHLPSPVVLSFLTLITNKVLHLLDCKHCSHSFVVVLNFYGSWAFLCSLPLLLVVRTVFEHVWLYVCRHSFLVWQNIHDLLAFLFHSHSFLVMRKVRASFRLVSWLLSFGRDISHERETVQPNLCYRRRYSEPAEVRFCFDIWHFRPCMGES